MHYNLDREIKRHEREQIVENTRESMYAQEKSIQHYNDLKICEFYVSENLRCKFTSVKKENTLYEDIMLSFSFMLNTGHKVYCEINNYYELSFFKIDRFYKRFFAKRCSENLNEFEREIKTFCKCIKPSCNEAFALVSLFPILYCKCIKPSCEDVEALLAAKEEL
jgi:hypothetical protein